MSEAVGILGLYLFLESREIAHKPLSFAIALENKQMRAYSIEEKSVVADYHRAALEIDYRLL